MKTREILKQRASIKQNGRCPFCNCEFKLFEALVFHHTDVSLKKSNYELYANYEQCFEDGILILLHSGCHSKLHAKSWTKERKIACGNGNRGRKQSEEEISKRAKSIKAVRSTEESRLKTSIASKNQSEESREKRRQSFIKWREEHPETVTKMNQSLADAGEKTRFQKGHQLSLGRLVSEETRKKIGDAHRGKPAWNKGIPTSEESKEKNRLAHLKISDETRRKMSESAKRRGPNLKQLEEARKKKLRFKDEN